MTDDAQPESLLDDDSPAAQVLAVSGFHAIWRGETPPVSSLCNDPAIIERLVAAGRLEIDDAGRLVGVHGVTTRPTRHQIRHADGTVHTWCAFDAIGIPAALGIDAVAATSCPDCGQDLDVTIRDGSVSGDDRALLWLPSGDCGHLMDEFCRHANLYCDRDHLLDTIDTIGTDGSGDILSVADAAELGRRTWRDVTPSCPQ